MTKLEGHEYQALVYAVSHDLGAPLRGMHNFAKLLRENCTDCLDDQAKLWLDVVYKDSLKAQTMINGLLTYSRLESQPPPVEAINLNNMVENIIAGSLVSAVEAKNHVEVMPLPAIMGPYDHWYLLLKELITNGLLYQESDLPKVRVSFIEAPSSDIIRIEDNGIGIAPDKISQVTQVFKRLHAETDYPGVGLGLSHAERILQQQHGFLDLSPSDMGGLQVDCHFAKGKVISPELV